MQFEYSETSSGSQCPIPLDFALRFDHLADQLAEFCSMRTAFNEAAASHDADQSIEANRRLFRRP